MSSKPAKSTNVQKNIDQKAQDLSKAIMSMNGFTAVGLPRMLEINGVTRAIYDGKKK